MDYSEAIGKTPIEDTRDGIEVLNRSENIYQMMILGRIQQWMS